MNTNTLNQVVAGLEQVRREELLGFASKQGATAATILDAMACQGPRITAALAALDGQAWHYQPYTGDGQERRTLAWQPWHRADGLPLAFWWDLRNGRIAVRPGLVPSITNGRDEHVCPLGTPEPEATSEAGRFIWGNPASIARALQRHVLDPVAPHWAAHVAQRGRRSARQAVADGTAAALVRNVPGAVILPNDPTVDVAHAVVPHGQGKQYVLATAAGRIVFPSLTVRHETAVAIAAALAGDTPD